MKREAVLVTLTDDALAPPHPPPLSLAYRQSKPAYVVGHPSPTQIFVSKEEPHVSMDSAPPGRVPAPRSMPTMARGPPVPVLVLPKPLGQPPSVQVGGGAHGASIAVLPLTLPPISPVPALNVLDRSDERAPATAQAAVGVGGGDAVGVGPPVEEPLGVVDPLGEGGGVDGGVPVEEGVGGGETDGGGVPLRVADREGEPGGVAAAVSVNDGVRDALAPALRVAVPLLVGLSEVEGGEDGEAGVGTYVQFSTKLPDAPPLPATSTYTNRVDTPTLSMELRPPAPPQPGQSSSPNRQSKAPGEVGHPSPTHITVSMAGAPPGGGAHVSRDSTPPSEALAPRSSCTMVAGPAEVRGRGRKPPR